MVAGALLKSSKSSLCLLQCMKALASQSRSFNSQLNDQQLAIQELARTYANDRLKPNASKLDLQGLFPFEQIRQLTNLGLMGACADQEYGGLGLDYLSLAVAVEEISRGCASTGMVVSIHNFLYANLVNERGTPEQKERFLCDFTKGAIGCFALSEPDAGSDVANIKTTARQDGDYWILNGKKSWVTSAVEGAATVVFATFDPALRHKGLACFLVPLDAEGVFRGKKEHLMGVRAATACDLTLEEVRIPNAFLIGQAGEGFKIAMGQLDQGRIGIAAHAVDMCIMVETARLLTYRAATDVSTKNSSMAKYVAGRNAAAVADNCVQILGGRGLSTKFNAERHFRDARGTQIYGGVTDIQKRLVGHFLLKENDAL
ncbi:jg4062 [Pararge aegeria aegeria]|uniref:Jg4062 protein n=1 Tax=Pararge aegeria aegeria TaxID=348720 RepID=A0A8S4R5F2_9NEOP|nr:jg4062 [Pararge aegeria aegeria]